MTRAGPHEGWLDRSESDLGYAKAGLREGYYPQACFVAQQAIEKALKGYLICRRRRYPKIHKLVELAALCKEGWLNGFHEGLKIVDMYYIPSRYPEALPGTLPDGLPGKREATEAIELAEDVLEAIRRHVR